MSGRHVSHSGAATSGDAGVVSVEASPSLQICSGRGKSWRGRRQIGSNGIEDRAVAHTRSSSDSIVISSQSDAPRLSDTRWSPFSSSRLRRITDFVSLTSSVRPRRSARPRLADPNRGPLCERALANGYAIGKCAASFEELELPVGHVTILRCATGPCPLPPARGLLTHAGYRGSGCRWTFGRFSCSGLPVGTSSTRRRPSGSCRR